MQAIQQLHLLQYNQLLPLPHLPRQLSQFIKLLVLAKQLQLPQQQLTMLPGQCRWQVGHTAQHLWLGPTSKPAGSFIPHKQLQQLTRLLRRIPHKL